MLIEKKGFSKNDLISFKLVNGEELIARLIEENQDEYIISKPISLAPSPQGMALVPYVMTADITETSLKKSHVIMCGISNADLNPAYIQSTTGITTINNSIVK